MVRHISFKDWCDNNGREDYLLDWDYEKNHSLSPSSILRGTHNEYYWKCHYCGTEYLRAPHSFTARGKNGCPICSSYYRGEGRRRASVKKNNLALNYPILAKEWDEEKNNCSAKDISLNSNCSYWWKCSICGHNWKAIVTNRTKGGTGCPKCNNGSHTSFPEKAVFYYIQKWFPDAISSDKHLGIELDVFIPSINVGIEYDGQQWHQDIEKDVRKNKRCKSQRITLFRIRERNCWFWNEDSYLKLIPCESGSDQELENAIQVLLLELNIPFADINIGRDKKVILETYINAKKMNSLSAKFPLIASEWNSERNKPLSPDRIDYGSGIKCWWICSTCGYEFEATPNARTCKGTSCPVCAHSIAWSGYNDLATLYPDLMDEWDFSKNIENPHKLLPHSEKKVFWKCKNGHSWQSIIANRVKGKGCPYCARIKQQKKVMNTDTGVKFNSIKEAALFYGNVRGNHICDCCKGKRATALGYHWQYIDD